MATEQRSSAFTDYDAFLFHQGTNHEVYKKLGAHPDVENGAAGTRFAVWAPNASFACVLTARTGWENEKWMHRSEADGAVWECFLPDVGPGDAYRFVITGADGVLFCLVAETVALLFAAGVLDEVGLCATASMDTKPVIRKILIIIINFFITLKF